MKKLIVIEVIVFLVFLLYGCSNSINYEVEEVRDGIYKRENGEGLNIYDMLGTNICHLFRDYEELELFLNKYDLSLSNAMESKYNNDYFHNKALIVYFGLDSSAGYKYKFNLYVEKTVLRCGVEKSRKKNGIYAEVLVNRTFFVDINQEDINNVNGFEFFINVNN